MNQNSNDMKTISTKEELKKALEGGEKEVKVEDAKLLKSLSVQYWIQKNKVKGALLLAALPAAIAAGGVAAPIIGIVGAGLVIGGATISAAEIIVIGGIILALVAILKGHKIKGIDMKHGVVRFE